MKNVNQILRSLNKMGFSLENGNGSIVKIIPPDKNLPFYSFHVGERGLHPLRRFAKKHWNIDVSKL